VATIQQHFQDKQVHEGSGQNFDVSFLYEFVCRDKNTQQATTCCLLCVLFAVEQQRHVART
jgi:hypothetical protein